MYQTLLDEAASQMEKMESQDLLSASLQQSVQDWLSQFKRVGVFGWRLAIPFN